MVSSGVLIGAFLALMAQDSTTTHAYNDTGMKKNVLFLVSDDMRPQLNVAYGQKFMHTPNLDKLASESE